MILGFYILLILSSVSTAQAASGQLANLTEVSTFITHEPHDAEFYKDHLYIADGNSLLIYNTSDHERPKLVTRFTDFNDPRLVNGLSISEERLYIAGGPGWIYVLNISDPKNPEKLYQLNYLDSSNDVAVSGKYMYVADANTGLLIFDLRDGRNPELAGMFYILKSNISGSLQGWGGISVEILGNYAFLSGANNKGLYVIDVSAKTVPREVFHSPGKNVYDIAISGKDVYLARADGTSDFDLLNVSNAPVITGNFSIAGTVDRSAIAISDEYIYAASGDAWHIFRMQDALPPRITIQEPGQGEIILDRTIEVSGTASDTGGIAEVLVNRKFAGTESWRQTIALAEGSNSINITASDKNGNHRTEIIQVTYHIPERTAAPTATRNVAVPATEGIRTTESPIAFYLIPMAFTSIVLMVIAYLIWIRKTRK